MLIGYRLFWERSIITNEIFFETMAFRFVEADGTLIEELKHGIQNKNTKRSTAYWTGVLKQWAVTKGKKGGNWELQGVKSERSAEKCCPLCYKQVIASALGQLRINFTCISKFSRLGQFWEKFENTREYNP